MTIQARTEPWSALERAGLMSPGSRASIGSRLDHQTRNALADVVDTLNHYGVEIQYQRGFHVPLIMSKYGSLSGQEAVRHIESQSTVFSDPLYVGGSGKATYPVESLRDLQALAAIHLAGSTAGLAQPAVAAALASLVKHGLNVTRSKEDYYYYETEAVSALAAYKKAAGNDNRRVYLEMSGISQMDATAENIIMVDFFHGSGTDRGLQNATLGANLKALGKQGYKFTDASDYYHSDLSAMQAYQKVASTGKLQVRAPGGKGPLVPMDAATLNDVTLVEAAVKRNTDLFTAHLKGLADKKVVSEKQVPQLIEAALKASPTTPDVPLSRISRLVEASSKSRDNYYVVENALKDYEKLMQGGGTESEVEARVNDFVDLLKAMPRAKAWGCYDYLCTRLRNRAFNDADYKQLRQLYLTLSQALGSHEAAVEGMDTVRITIGDETLAQRVQLLVDLAERESEKNRSKALVNYRAILANRLPEEGLLETGRRFCQLHDGLTRTKNESRINEVFEFIQVGAAQKALGSLNADTATRRFMEGLLLTKDVDTSKLRLRDYREAGGAGTVERTDTSVQIGNVELPRN